MFWNKKPTDRMPEEAGRERRNTHRHELLSPVICAVRFGEGPAHLGVVRDISVGGVLVEFQVENGLESVGDGAQCTVTDMLPDAYRTLSDTHAIVEWRYKKFIGIAFYDELFQNDEDLVKWCAKNKISYRKSERHCR